MLTQEETADLLIKAKNGDVQAMYDVFMYDVWAGSYELQAINNYDSNYNVKFTTYAVPMIAGEIKRFLRDDGSVKVSRSIKHSAILIKNYISEYSSRFQTNPTLENIAKALNMDINDIVLAMSANTSPISLNEKFSSDDDSSTFMDKLPDDFSVEKLVDKLALREIIDLLSAREKQIIIMRYFLDKTQSEIAKELGVSQVQVSRIENKVLNEMKEKMQI